MKGVSKLNGRSDLRLPITVEMMVKLPNALDHVCKSKYEFLLFMSAFSLSFSALLRVGEITASNSVDAKKKSFKCRILGLKRAILFWSYGI
jgi:hypothetical protein